jgi:hypothetical protein
LKPRCSVSRLKRRSAEVREEGKGAAEIAYDPHGKLSDLSHRRQRLCKPQDLEPELRLQHQKHHLR